MGLFLTPADQLTAANPGPAMSWDLLFLLFCIISFDRFFYHFIDSVLPRSSEWLQIHFVAQVSLELEILLSPFDRMVTIQFLKYGRHCGKSYIHHCLLHLLLSEQVLSLEHLQTADSVFSAPQGTG